MKRSKNVLTMVPYKNPKIKWSLNDNLIILTKSRTRFIDKIIHKILKTPLQTNLELEEIGSYIWQQVNGQNTIYDISILVDSKFGQKAHPLLDRLVTYMKILNDNKYIFFK